MRTACEPEQFLIVCCGLFGKNVWTFNGITEWADIVGNRPIFIFHLTCDSHSIWLSQTNTDLPFVGSFGVLYLYPIDKIANVPLCRWFASGECLKNQRIIRWIHFSNPNIQLKFCLFLSFFAQINFPLFMILHKLIAFGKANGFNLVG